MTPRTPSSTRVDRPLGRRALLAALAGGAGLLAGCLGDDEVDLDPDDFEDESFYHVAVGVARAGHELESIDRSEDGWLEVRTLVEVDLERHMRELDRAIDTPGPDEPVPPFYLGPPNAEPIIDGYIEAVDAGETSEGLRVFHDDGRCRASYAVPRNRVDWYLNDTLEIRYVYGESLITYGVDCDG